MPRGGVGQRVDAAIVTPLARQVNAIRSPYRLNPTVHSPFTRFHDSIHPLHNHITHRAYDPLGLEGVKERPTPPKPGSSRWEVRYAQAQDLRTGSPVDPSHFGPNGRGMGCFHQGLRNGNLKLRDHDLGANKNLSTEGTPSGYNPREQQRSRRPTHNRITHQRRSDATITPASLCPAPTLGAAKRPSVRRRSHVSRAPIDLNHHLPRIEPGP